MAIDPQEQPVLFQNFDGVWERSGYCCRCGECCVDDPFNGSEGEPKLAGYCPLLDLLDDTFTCTNRNHPYYLNGCAHWPSHPAHIEDKPSCTYVFTKVAE